jgi:hypothetical protein
MNICGKSAAGEQQANYRNRVNRRSASHAADRAILGRNERRAGTADAGTKAGRTETRLRKQFREAGGKSASELRGWVSKTRRGTR